MFCMIALKLILESDATWIIHMYEKWQLVYRFRRVTHHQEIKQKKRDGDKEQERISWGEERLLIWEYWRRRRGKWRGGEEDRRLMSLWLELFFWSYRHLNENANNLIKECKRAEREGARRKKRHQIKTRLKTERMSRCRTMRQKGRGENGDVEEREE